MTPAKNICNSKTRNMKKLWYHSTAYHVEYGMSIRFYVDETLMQAA